MAYDEKDMFQLFPFCTAVFKDLNKFLICCLFWDRALERTHFAPHPRVTDWCNTRRRYPWITF